MEMKRFLYYLIAISVVIVSMSTGLYSQEKSSSTSEQPASSTAPTQATSAPSSSFKSYPDHSFHLKVREYTHGMQKGGHNLLIWKDPAETLSKYSSVKATQF